MARGMDESSKGDCCKEVSSPVEEDGERGEDGVAVEGDGRAKPEDVRVRNLLLEVLGLDVHNCGIFFCPVFTSVRTLECRLCWADVVKGYKSEVL